jgi:hypothetical protein
MIDDDGSRLSVSSDRTKISGFNPLLATVWTAYTAEPLSSFYDPPVERAAGGPGCCLELDRRIHLTSIGFGVVIDLHI